MKVIGISCPITLGKHAKIVSVHFPIGLGVLLAHLRNNGFEVELWDYNVDNFSDESFIERLNKSKPKVVGMSATTAAIKGAHQLATLIKSKMPEVITIIGGPHVDALPTQSIEEFPNFDIIVYGEAEDTFVELCKRIEKNESLEGCEGIVHRKDGEIIKEKPRPLIQNLDKLPYAARDLVNFDNYKTAHVQRGISRKFMNVMEFMTSRGCPAKCIFCASGANKPPTVRWRSVQHVVGEIDQCVEKYGTTYVDLMDDTFTLNKKYVSDFCDAMKARGLQWGCLTRVDCVTKELLQMMVDAGCIRISFGVESGSPRIMAMNGKAITIDKVRQAFKWAHEVKLKIIDGSFIIGSHPDENHEDIEQTIRLIKEVNPNFFSVSIIAPLPGTASYTMMKSEGLIMADSWEKFLYIGEKPSWRTRNFSPEELVRLQKYVLRKTYFRPGYVVPLLLKIRNINEFRYFASLGWESFKQVLLSKETWY